MGWQPWDNLDFRQLNDEVNEMALQFTQANSYADSGYESAQAHTSPSANRPLYDVTLDSLVTRLSTINKCIEDMKVEKSTIITEMHKRNVMPVPTINEKFGVE